MKPARPGIGRRAAGALVALATLALPASGCGFGPGDPVGEAELTVSRDFGSEVILDAEVGDLTESDTVLRVLDRSAGIETRYGGGFVNSIEGIEGGTVDGRPHDWLYFVNGVEADRGSADIPVGDGDRIWWDYRDWSTAMRVPAVVGQFPEPFLNGYDDGAGSVAVECHDLATACEEVRSRLQDAGAELAGSTEGSDPDAIRVAVGTWEAVSREPAGRAIARGPAYSGVFARPAGADAPAREWMSLLGPGGEAVETVGPSAGLVAATRVGGRPPIWLVTGGDAAGVAAAADALDEDSLRLSYAVAVEGERVLGLPVR